MHQQIAVPKVTLKKRRKWRWRVALAGLLVIVAAGVAFFEGKPAIEVTTEQAAIRDVTQVISATGKVRPQIEVDNQVSESWA